MKTDCTVFLLCSKLESETRKKNRKEKEATKYTNVWPELTEFLSSWRYFTPEVLCTLISTGETVVLLSNSDVQQLIADGLFERSKYDGSKALKMFIYAVGEPHKTRRRLIIWTMDINEQTENPLMTPFNAFEVMMDEGMQGISWTTDSKACYHQFALPEEAKPYYTFYVQDFGWLNLTTAPTGQRQTVGMAQTVSRFIMRQTIQRSEKMNPAFCSFHETYIDNFRATHPNREMTKISLANFYTIAAEYDVTINESMKEAAAAIKTIRIEAYFLHRPAA